MHAPPRRRPGAVSDAFPKAQLGLLSLAFFAHAINLTVLFPFAGPMARHFGLVHSAASMGQYAGYLASAFSAARLLTSSWWGRRADVHGRKHVVVFALASAVVCGVAFGLSPSFQFAVAVRFAFGLSNGCVSAIQGGSFGDCAGQAPRLIDGGCHGQLRARARAWPGAGRLAQRAGDAVARCVWGRRV